MNKFIATVIMVIVAVSAYSQEYKSRQPRPPEREKISGVDWYLKDGPRYQIFNKTTGEGENYTLQATNSYIILRSLAELTNTVIIFPNPTNNLGRVFDIVLVGNITATLTNNPVGTFNSMTNVTASTVTLPTNSTARVVNNMGTNWLVIPGTK